MHRVIAQKPMLFRDVSGTLDLPKDGLGPTLSAILRATQKKGDGRPAPDIPA